ncbi:MAG: nucleotidyltransferase domain-containing protein [Alphaproteobacteria bacterium]
MDHEPLFRAIADRLRPEPGLAALFLAGSHGAGTADRFSDIDLVAVADAGHHGPVAALWREVLESLHPVVFWNERRGRGILLNAISEDWLRCDLHIVARDDLAGRCRATLRPLFDRAGVYDALPATLPPAQPDPERVRRSIDEFIRVLGLMTVGIGRGEYVTMVKGVGLLRDLLTDLMLEECPLPDRGGVLHLSRLLPPERMAQLQALPWPGPERDALIAANLAIAEAFFPLARRLARDLAVAWPERFEAATRRHLQKELGVAFR